MAAGHARFSRLIGGTAVAAAVCLGACSSSGNSATAQSKAEQLVAATEAAGVAPRLNVDTAESLYGTKAPAVCDAFDGGLSTTAENILFGNPAHGRAKTITDEAVTYGRLVIEVYCPDELSDYDHAVEALDPIARNRR
ncbi:MAG: hypothetical protein ACK5O2_02525 [Microthrixaceae bacterium]